LANFNFNFSIVPRKNQRTASSLPFAAYSGFAPLERKQFLKRLLLYRLLLSISIMFFLIFGRGRRLSLCPPSAQTELGVNPTCLHPGCTGHVQLWKFSTYCHLCFIPLIPFSDREMVKCQLCGRAYERAVYAFNVNRRNMWAKNNEANSPGTASCKMDLPMAQAQFLEVDNPEVSANEDQGLTATAKAITVV
jgi:hypothetical protein